MVLTSVIGRSGNGCDDHFYEVTHISGLNRRLVETRPWKGTWYIVGKVREHCGGVDRG